MKKNVLTDSILVLLALVSVGVLAFAATRNYPTEPATFQVPTVSTMIAAPRLVRAPNWVAGTVYQQGDMVRSTAHTSRVYWNVTTNGVPTSAATTNPDHLSVTTDAVDGLMTWRRVVPRARSGITVVNNGGSSIWLAIGHAAATNCGVMLTPSGTWWMDNDSVQAGVHAISGIGYTNTVSTQEW